MADIAFNLQQTVNAEFLTAELKTIAEIDGLSLVGQSAGAHLFEAEKVIVHATGKLTAAQQMSILDAIEAHDPRKLTEAQLAQQAEEAAKEEATLTLRELVNTLNASVENWQSLDDVKRDMAAWLPALVERLV
jgi:hypothetical protein